MSIIGDQIRQRRELEDNELEKAFYNMAEAVVGRIPDARDDDLLAREAVNRIEKYFHLKNDAEAAPKPLGESLEERLRPAGIGWRDVRLGKNWYRDAIGAFIAYRKEDGTPVALIPGAFGGYYFTGLDGREHRVTRKDQALFNEEAIAFYRAFPGTRLTLPRLMRFMVECLTPGDILKALLAAGAVALVGLLIPYINSALFSDVIAGENIDLLIAIGVFYLSAIISRQLMSVVYNLLLARITTKVSTQMEAAAMLRVLSLPVSFFRDFSAGELSARIEAVNGLCEVMLSTALKTGLTALCSLIYIVQIALAAPSLVLPAMVILIVTLILNLVFALAQEKKALENYTIKGREKSLSYQLISGMRKIRVAGAEKRGFTRWARLYAALVNCEHVITRYQGVMTLALTLIGTWVLYNIAIHTGVTKVEYRVFAVAFGMTSGAMSTLASVMNRLAGIRPALSRAQPILETLPEVQVGKKKVDSLRGGIELENVRFRYSEGTRWIADGLNLKVRPGEYVAIVGKTGIGKSTLIRLMIGFEKPEFGTVSYDGRNIASLDLGSLRRQIGIVTQNGKLIQGDVYANIALTCPGLPEEEAWRAAEIAGIADDIRAMPMGMSTPLSESGGVISGGQKQRLLIARAIAAGPRVLIFDEATSALDNITQKRVTDALGKLACTRIVIAHRLSTIRQCDRILVLDAGRIVADGKYGELMETSELFRELVERQRVASE